MSKSIIFLLKSFLGNFYRHLAIFFWSHCPLSTLDLSGKVGLHLALGRKEFTYDGDRYAVQKQVNGFRDHKNNYYKIGWFFGSHLSVRWTRWCSCQWIRKLNSCHYKGKIFFISAKQQKDQYQSSILRLIQISHRLLQICSGLDHHRLICKLENFLTHNCLSQVTGDLQYSVYQP